jgi:DNA-binding response OmpR family regulator
MDDTILYISDRATSNHSVLAALEATGYDIVTTNSAAQAVALLFVMQSPAAVVMDQAAGKDTSLDLVRNLRSICTDVPIFLLSRDQINPLPSGADACVSVGQSLEHLTSALRALLDAKRVLGKPFHCGSADLNADCATGD